MGIYKRNFLYVLIFAMLFSIPAFSEEEDYVPKAGDNARDMFMDISTHWAKNEIKSAGEKGIITGLDDGYFEPDIKITRAEFAAFVTNSLGITKRLYKDIYNDVDYGDKYSSEVQTLSDTTIVTGYAGNFLPLNPISREEAVSIFIRACEWKRDSEFLGMAELTFSDSNNISEWARENIQKAVFLNMIKGVGENMFSPKGMLTRAEAVVLINKIDD